MPPKTKIEETNSYLSTSRFIIQTGNVILGNLYAPYDSFLFAYMRNKYTYVNNYGRYCRN